MKITKKKAQEALNKRIAKREAGKLEAYRDYMKKEVADAEKELADHIAATQRKKRLVAEAKANLAKFNKDNDKDKYVPAYIKRQFQFDTQTQERIERVQRKIDLAQGDVINVTDGELLVL